MQVDRKPGDAPAAPAELYVELLKAVLTRLVAPERYAPLGMNTNLEHQPPPRHDTAFWHAVELVRDRGFEVVHTMNVHTPTRIEGRDWPPEAETMVGTERLTHLQECILDIIHRRVPGDLLEAGVWRGGTAIFMRGVLAAYGEPRTVWVADSFHGLPPPDDAAYPADLGDIHHTAPELAVDEQVVRANFHRYGLLDEHVRFIPGWFRDSLPGAPVQQLALLRIDADMYEGTLVALSALYPKLSRGGYVIIDDYGALPACRQAVDDFRNQESITDAMLRQGWTAVAWRKS